MKISPLLLAGAAAVLSLGNGPVRDVHPVGYDDTPFLPGGLWRVHDSKRPAPVVVEPGAGSFAPPPADAIVLFDGTSTDAWQTGGEAIGWKVVDGEILEVVGGSGQINTRAEFGDCQLHLEWASPAVVQSESQGRGNSGVFMMGRYEIQILDSYKNRTYADGQAAALYGQHPPDVNVCRAPGEWQSYDIIFEAPRFVDGRLDTPARVTVIHNGVLVHHAREFIGATRHAAVATYSEHAAVGAIGIQDHGNPVRFRNIWLRDLR